MTARALLRLAVGTGLAVCGLALLGDALSPPRGPDAPPAAPGHGSLPPLPGPTPAAEPASAGIEREEVCIPVRGGVLGGTGAGSYRCTAGG